MTDWSGFTVERDGAVDIVTLDRTRRLNAIDPAMASDLARYFQNLRLDRVCRVVILRGAGDAFCSGVDLTAVQEMPHDKRWGYAGVHEELRIQASNRQFIIEMRACSQVIVVEMHGVACGAGFALALASDIRLATRAARMNCAFVRVGLGGCDIGVSYFLPRMAGVALASDLMLTGRFLSSEEAFRVGLVAALFPDVAALREGGRAKVAELLAVAPAGLKLAKEALRFAIDAPSLEATIAMEDRNQVLCARTEDYHEGIASFNERRAPVWGGA